MREVHVGAESPVRTGEVGGGRQGEEADRVCCRGHCCDEGGSAPLCVSRRTDEGTPQDCPPRPLAAGLFIYVPLLCSFMHAGCFRGLELPGIFHRHREEA